MEKLLKSIITFDPEDMRPITMYIREYSSGVDKSEYLNQNEKIATFLNLPEKIKKDWLDTFAFIFEPNYTVGIHISKNKYECFFGKSEKEVGKKAFEFLRENNLYNDTYQCFIVNSNNKPVEYKPSFD